MKRMRIPLSRYPFSPSTYPGRRPRFSFLFTRRGLRRITLDQLDEVLRGWKLPPMTERYAILAYGSNACPGQLFIKGLDNVPVIFGRLCGAQAVYARRTTQKSGNVPSTLARIDGERWSWITLLTREQLQTMDQTEGRRTDAYVLAELLQVNFRVASKRFAPLYSYVNMAGGVMTIDGKAVSLRSMGQKRAKSILENSVEAHAAECLDFEIIPYPNFPVQYSKLVRQ